MWNSRQLRKHLFNIKTTWLKVPGFPCPSFLTFSQLGVTHTRSQAVRWGLGWRGGVHSSVPQQVAKGHSWSLALGEITAQETEGKGVSSRASLSLGLYLKNTPHTWMLWALSLCKALHWKELKTPKPAKRCRNKSVGSTGGMQDREWLHTTAGSRQGRVLRRQSDE